LKIKEKSHVVLSKNASVGNELIIKKEMEIPHPNSNSHLFDRIITRGKIDPNTRKVVVPNEAEKYSYDQWHYYLEPEAKILVEKEHMNQVPTFKRL